MVNVYAWNYHRIFLIMLFLLILWRILARYIRIDIWKILNLFGAGVSFFLILKFTVLGRTPSGVHQFVVMAPYSDEFFSGVADECLFILSTGTYARGADRLASDLAGSGSGNCDRELAVCGRDGHGAGDGCDLQYAGSLDRRYSFSKKKALLVKSCCR